MEILKRLQAAPERTRILSRSTTEPALQKKLWKLLESVVVDVQALQAGIAETIEADRDSKRIAPKSMGFQLPTLSRIGSFDLTDLLPSYASPILSLGCSEIDAEIRTGSAVSLKHGSKLTNEPLKPKNMEELTQTGYIESFFDSMPPEFPKLKQYESKETKIFVNNDLKTIKLEWARSAGLEVLIGACRDAFGFDGYLCLKDETYKIEYQVTSCDDIQHGALIEYRTSTALDVPSTLVSDKDEGLRGVSKKIDSLIKELNMLRPKYQVSLRELKLEATLRGTYREVKSLKEELHNQRETFSECISNVNNTLDSLLKNRSTAKISALDDTAKRFREFEGRLEKFQTLLEVTRVDLTRGVKPPPHLNAHLLSEYEELRQKVSGSQKWLGILKPKCQTDWQNEVAIIKNDQKRLMGFEASCKDITIVLEEMEECLDTVTKVLGYQMKHEGYVPAHVIMNVMDAETSKNQGMSNLLKELAKVQIANRKPLDTLLQFEQVRKTCSTKEETFKDELVAARKIIID